MNIKYLGVVLAIFAFGFAVAPSSRAGTEVIQDYSASQPTYNYAPPPPRPSIMLRRRPFRWSSTGLTATTPVRSVITEHIDFSCDDITGSTTKRGSLPQVTASAASSFRAWVA
jgi:hypothetical protein